MAVPFDTLANPTTFSVELSILILGMLISYLYAAIRLRSTITITLWLFAVVSLILKILIDLSFVWFWVVMLLDTIMIVISMTILTFFNSRI